MSIKSASAYTQLKRVEVDGQMWRAIYTSTALFGVSVGCRILFIYNALTMGLPRMPDHVTELMTELRLVVVVVNCNSIGGLVGWCMVVEGGSRHGDVLLLLLCIAVLPVYVWLMFYSY